MPLLTIDDLMNGDPAEVLELTTMATGISQMYEKFIDEEPKDGNKRSPGIHASEISGCERKVVYSLLKTERRDEAAPVWRKRFKIGHAIHEMFQRDFNRMAKREDMNIDFVEEATIAPDRGQYYASKWDIYSHCDGIFTIKDARSGVPIVRVALEIKSSAPDDYEKMKAPKPEHIEQAHVYMACLDVPLVWFLYYNKGNQNYTGSDNPSFFVKFDPKVWAGLEERFERFHTSAALGVLPDRQESIVCEFCPFVWTCGPKTVVRRKGFHVPHPRWSR